MQKIMHNCITIMRRMILCTIIMLVFINRFFISILSAYEIDHIDTIHLPTDY